MRARKRQPVRKQFPSFWNHEKQDETYHELSKLIPAQGAVKNPVKNRALEDWRKLQNAYYRFYNDGDRYGRLGKMFERYGFGRPWDYDDEVLLERLADTVFAAAVREQLPERVEATELEAHPT